MMKKLQAAMEYLMTYGWAILIIALALGVLYSLGVLNPGRLKPVMCMLPAPFSCQIQSFNTAGALGITLAQGSGSSITINKIACVDNSLLTSAGLPSNNAFWNSPSSSMGLSLPSGSSMLLSTPTIYCYIRNSSAASGGSPFRGTMGSSFGGTLIINYTLPSGTYAFTSGTINAQVNTP
jgi:hypothetical protein